MKKFLAFVASLAVIVSVAGVSEKPAAAQVLYCNACCDLDPWGNARIRCALVSPFPCGGTCICEGIPGYGFSCY